MTSVIFIVKSANKIVGEFGSKSAAKQHRDELNGGAFGSEKSTDAFHVTRGKDHWRGLTGLVPQTKPQGSRKNVKTETKKGGKK
ncbi:MAG: hypothetical protein QXN55_00895 [Candidatus Nitrosotenuis sp.]